ncbi:MAG: MMPL family transporter, partial [Angustibacter sp.]
ITNDLKLAEAIAIPLQFILLLFVFGTLLSAGLPFIVALGSVVGSFFALWLVSLTTDVSIFALNLVTGLGLGLGIDYALLIVTRFREEMHGDHGESMTPAVAVARTMATAGRTVLFSGITVILVMGAMLFFPQFFLKSFGYAGIAATGLAMISALTALPALLALAGSRIDNLRILRRDLFPSDEGAWSRVASFVMRRPVPIALAVLSLLGILTAPVFGVRFAEIDERALPASNPVARSAVVMNERFDGLAGVPANIVVANAAQEKERLADYALEISRLPRVVSVITPTVIVADGRLIGPNPEAEQYVSGATARLSVVADVNPRSVDGSRFIDRVRSVKMAGYEPEVGGTAAEFTDSQQGIADSGKWALLWIALSTIILLFLFTGSILLSVKAIVLNVVSLLATLGTLVWIFQEGHLKWLVGDFTVTNSVDTSMAVLIAVVAFALSMDYEVFLISRIVEEHRNGLSTERAVARGLQRSGRIITAAALLLAVVFASFVSSGVTSIKQLGFGVAFAILLDATVVRGLLVPALMRLAGRWNWWAPKPLARLHAAIGLSD